MHKNKEKGGNLVSSSVIHELTRKGQSAGDGLTEGSGALPCALSPPKDGTKRTTPHYTAFYCVGVRFVLFGLRIFEVDIVLCIGLVLAWGTGFQVWSGMTEKSKLGMARKLMLEMAGKLMSGMTEKGFPQGRQGMGRGRRSRP